jgi:hypothetical protein
MDKNSIFENIEYWVKNINIVDAILNIDPILIFQDRQQFFYNRTVQ